MAWSAPEMGSEIWESESKLEKTSVFDGFRSHFHLRISECKCNESPVVPCQ